MAEEKLAHRLVCRTGIEDEVGLRLGDGVVREGVVEEMIEDPAVEGFRGGKVVPEPLQPLTPRVVARPDGEPAELAAIGRKGMRLGVAEDLEPVFQLPQEPVVAVEDRPLLIGQRPRLGEAVHGLDRVAGADGWRIAAAEELEELDRILDVTDSPRSELDVVFGPPLVGHLPLHPPLQRLDLTDVGGGEPASVDPRRE